MKLLFLKDYNLTPTDAKIIFNKNFPNIKINDKAVENYIYTKYREANKINKELLTNTEKIFHLKDNDNNEITETIKYKIDGLQEELIFIIISTQEMLNNLQNNLIDEFFMDATYSCVPPSIIKFKLLVLCGYESAENKICLLAFILIMNEKKETFENIFIYLKNRYKFNPTNFMCDFKLSQVQAIQKVFVRCNIHCCFFHYSQSIWRNFKKYQLCGKGTYDTNYELLLNLQILCFIKKDKMENFYDKIKKNLKKPNLILFFNILRGHGWVQKYQNHYGIFRMF